MAVGIRIRGASGQMQISDQAPCYMHLFTSSFNNATNPLPGYESPAGTYASTQTVYFPQVVATTAPPLVFMRPIGKAWIYKFGILGSPGNWTGFRIMVFPYDQNFTGISADYFVASATVPKSNTPIGIRIRNKDTNEIIFDSGYKLVKFQSFATTVYTGYDPEAFRTMSYCIKPANSFMLMNQYSGVPVQGATPTVNGLLGLWFNTNTNPDKVYFWASDANGNILSPNEYIWAVVFATVGT